MAAEDTMAVAGEVTMVADTMAVAGAMVMEATIIIPVLVFSSAHRFILILTIAIRIRTLIIIRQPWSPYR